SQGLSSNLRNFKVETQKPFELRTEGKVLAKNVTLSGKGDPKGMSFRFHIPSLLGKMGVDLTLGRRAGSDRLWGSYGIRPHSIQIGPDVSLKNISLRGAFETNPFAELFERPKIFINGSADSKLSGFLEGPLSSHYNGSLSYQPEKETFSLWLNPKTSRIAVGPLSPGGEGLSFEGKAELQGAYLFRPTKHGWVVGGTRVGIKNGNLLFDPDGPQGQAPAPLLNNLSLIADQLWNIRKGIVYTGGDGIRFETDLHLSALQVGVPASSEKRHVVYITDQLPVSA